MYNRDLYKAAMSGVRHSDDAVERIFDMTVDKKKNNHGLLLKRLASAALVLAILIGGGFGVNSAVKKNNSNDFSVLVAYASTGEYYKIGSQSRQDLFYSLYVIPENDKEKAKEVRKKYYEDYNKIRDQAEKLGQEGYGTSVGGGSAFCYDKDNNETAMLRGVAGGNIALDLQDYTDVKTFQVENKSEYGYIDFEYLAQYEKLFEMSKHENKDLTDEETRNLYGIGHKFKLTGDELRRSQEANLYAGGYKEPFNFGYSLNWYPSDELARAVGDNLNFDLSQIKDTITFTVEFNDGTVRSASLNLYFDSDGYMHFE